MQIRLKDFFSAESMTVEIAITETQEESHLPTHDQPAGVYSYLDNHLIGLFVIGEALFLSVDGNGSEIGEQRVRASLSGNGTNRRLELMINGSLIRLDYENDRFPVSTQFYSEDEEDADFGLWLTNVLASDQRRGIFVESWRTT